jgi:hypothetical protein
MVANSQSLNNTQANFMRGAFPWRSAACRFRFNAKRYNKPSEESETALKWSGVSARLEPWHPPFGTKKKRMPRPQSPNSSGDTPCPLLKPNYRGVPYAFHKVFQNT